MALIDLGNIRINWRGVFDPETHYVRDDAVSYKGSSFIAVKEVTNVIPAVGPHWNLLAAGTDQLTQEGDLLIHDGNTPVRLPRGKNAQVLQMVGNQPVWKHPPLDLSRRVWKLPQVNVMGGWHTRVYLMADGTLRACGQGGNYANGNPAGKDIYVPSRILTADPGGRDPEVRFVEVFSGSMQHYALTAEGDVWSWGHNNEGQLGQGDTVNRAIAKPIEFFVKNQIQIKKVIPARPNAYDTSCVYFLTRDGQVYACGLNKEGNLGNGTSANQLIPVRCGTLTNIVDVIVSGRPHSVYALQEDGALWVWGCNAAGQLGLGDRKKREAPIKHPLAKHVIKAVISCGYPPHGSTLERISIEMNPPERDSSEGKSVMGEEFILEEDGTEHFLEWRIAGHGLILQADGTVLVTGSNGEGQLGLGDTANRLRLTPLTHSEPFSDIFTGDGKYPSGGAITQQRELVLWGYNGYGQLGTGDTERQLIPFKPSSPFQGSVTLSVFGGGAGTEGCIVQAGNALWAAGYGGYGNIGIGMMNPVNSTFQRVLGESGTLADWGVFGEGTTHWGLGVLYTDGRVDACGASASFGETGTQTANIHNVAALTNVLFV